MRCMDKVVAKHALRDAGIPTPDFYAFSQTAFEELGATKALPAIEERLDFPIVVKPAAGGSALGINFARTRRRRPERAGGRASPTTPRSCSSATCRAATSPCPCSIAADGPEALPVVEAIPTDEDFYDFESRYEIGRTALRLPRRISPALTQRAQELALATYRTLGCAGFARVDLLTDGDDLTVIEANAIPGMTDTSLLPLAAEAGGIAFDAFVARVLDLAVARAAA